MSTLMKAIVLGTFSLAATCAMAAEPPAADAMETINVVTVTPPKYQVSPDEFMYLGGTYAFNNGAVLKFSKAGLNRYIVSLTGLPDTEVFAVSGNRFVARDKTINMVFAPHDSGFATHLTVQYKNPNPVAQNGVAAPEYIVASN